MQHEPMLAIEFDSNLHDSNPPRFGKSVEDARDLMAQRDARKDACYSSLNLKYLRMNWAANDMEAQLIRALDSVS
jgi:hypothetical protein